MLTMVEAMARRAQEAKLRVRTDSAPPAAASDQPKPEPKTRSDFRRQPRASAPLCPACGQKMIAKTTSVILTHYGCRNGQCFNRSLIPVARPMKADEAAALEDRMLDERIAESMEVDIASLGPEGARRPVEFYPGTYEPRDKRSHHRRRITEE